MQIQQLSAKTWQVEITYRIWTDKWNSFNIIVIANTINNFLPISNLENENWKNKKSHCNQNNSAHGSDANT